MSPSGDAEGPQSLQDFVVQRLTREMLSGAIPPGTRLSPSRLAEDFGVSHIPVREALARLVAVGEVRHVPRVGFFVAELSLGEIVDIYHWRQVLEDDAHRIAVPLLDDSDLSRMREINDHMLSFATDGDPQFLALNRSFHFIPFQKAGSEHLLRFITHLWAAAGRYQNVMAHARVPQTILKDQHTALLAAFEARDVDKVNSAMAIHRSVTLDTIRKIAQSGGGGCLSAVPAPPN